MKVALKNFQRSEADLVLIPVFSEGLNSIKEDYTTVLAGLRNKEKFKASEGELYSITNNISEETQESLFIGLGIEKELTAEKLRTIFAKVLKKSRGLKANKLYMDIIQIEKLCFGATIKAIVEGLCFGDYKFDKYKSEKTKLDNIEICIGSIPEGKTSEAEEYIKEAKILVKANFLARNLINEPANVIYPETLAKAAKKYGSEYGYEVEILEKNAIEKLEMNAFLSVAKASANEPRLIVMRYFGDGDNCKEILGLVGKGLTYDAGGYSLKSNEGMVNMKCDMGGAAAVIGAIAAIAKRKLKINVVAVVAACENLISGAAYKPGDIIGSMAGKTIEVLNTDAEGRLTLADAVYYTIEKENATRVIDIATLTGAVLVALGTTTTAAITNNEEFYQDIEGASKKSGEKMWLLPAFEEYKKQIKSDIADLKNLGGKHAGTITAGLFIGEFVKGKPWVHLDIAGTGWADSERDYYAKGGTGVGVRTLYYLAKGYAK
jgi:leucyl aminopeptidase